VDFNAIPAVSPASHVGTTHVLPIGVVPTVDYRSVQKYYLL
jgi:hypothetical protein